MRVGLKNDINHYGYKNSICIDAEHGFIRSFVVTPAGTKPFNPVPVGYIGTMYAGSWYSSNNDNRLVFVHGSSYDTRTFIGFGDVTENIFDPYSNFGGMNTVVDEVAGNLKVSWIR